VKQTHIDVALEWQHGPEEYPIRDILRKNKRDVPVLLCLNWNEKFPPNFDEIGYADYLNLPFCLIELMQKITKVLLNNKEGRL
jgi:hypothetical protein